jgi:CheY-like chemotaxis protein
MTEEAWHNRRAMPDSKLLEGLSILIVDDIPEARDLFTDMLRQAGAVTTGVASADEATRKLEHVRPDVVITDLSMPERDGLWLLKWIRERDTTQNAYTPVVAVTAHGDLYDTGDLRFDSCHVKPVAWNELLQGILVVTARAVPAST